MNSYSNPVENLVKSLVGSYERNNSSSPTRGKLLLVALRIVVSLIGELCPSTLTTVTMQVSYWFMKA